MSRRVALAVVVVGAVVFAAGCVQQPGSPPPTTEGVWWPAGCYDSTWDGEVWWGDLVFDGTPDVFANGTFFHSNDGTCSGGAMSTPTIVRAADSAEADAKCVELTQTPAIWPLDNSGFDSAPADAWVCGYVPLA